MAAIYISNFHSIKALIESYPENIVNLILVKNYQNKRAQFLEKIANEVGINFNYAEKKELQQACRSTKAISFLAEIILPKFESEIKSKEIINDDYILILDSIQDSHNLGAIIRTAYAAGIQRIIINKDNSAKLNEFVFNSSVGAIFKIKIHYVTNLNRTIKILKGSGFWVSGLEAKSPQSIYEYSFGNKVALVMGSEEAGIRRLVRDNCDVLLNIPMKTDMESLNLSVATGVCLFEINRQRNAKII